MGRVSGAQGVSVWAGMFSEVMAVFAPYCNCSGVLMSERGTLWANLPVESCSCILQIAMLSICKIVFSALFCISRSNVPIGKVAALDM